MSISRVMETVIESDSQIMERKSYAMCGEESGLVTAEFIVMSTVASTRTESTSCLLGIKNESGV